MNNKIMFSEVANLPTQFGEFNVVCVKEQITNDY